MRKSIAALIVSPLLVAVAASHFSCSSAPKSGSTGNGKTVPGKEALLHRDEAMYRSKQIRKITYQLWISLDSEADQFMGRVSAVFELREDADRFVDTLRMDFSQGTIQNLSVNQVEWKKNQIDRRYDGQRIEFKTSELLKGQNRIDISFTHPYAKTGNGLYRYKDPVDGKSYVFTNLEPYYANQIFPCFDQPDLKASYELTVETPLEWEVIANMAERDISKVAGRHSWQFPPSPLFSTYLFALHAGPFHEWKADAEGIPLRLFARESEAKSVDAENWFSVTKKGLAFFSDFYGTPYPYGKYDQVIVPNLNAGAMENIAAVTFNEKFIFKSKPTQADLLDRADVILHEMAHMWFGNLVTMRWWNGLWLNESFATYMAYLATKELKLFPGLVEQTFNRDAKDWAYFDDSLVTHHPIEVSVIDTANAFTLFDGITYGKGAAALQQLHQYVGDDDFREGLHRYFLKFANRNTVLNDLIQSIGGAAGRDLSPWQKAWLQTQGTNEATVKLACEGGRITSLAITQAAPGEGNVLRPHQIALGTYFIESNGALYKGKENYPVTLNGAETSVEDAKGDRCPSFVFVNEGDLGFIRQIFQPSDIELLKKHLHRVDTPLSRQMIWSTLMMNVRRGVLSAKDFDEIAKNHLPRETSPEIVSAVSRFMFTPQANFLSVLRILPATGRVEYLRSWWEIANKRLRTTGAGSDLQVAWFTVLSLAVNDPASADQMIQIALGKKKVPGLSLGTDRVFQALRSAARLIPIPEEHYVKLAETHQGEEALNQEIRTRATEPGSESKNGVFQLLTGEKKEPARWADTSRLRKVMPLFLHPLNEERMRAWTPIYLQNLERVNQEFEDHYAETFAGALYPALCDPQQAALLEAQIPMKKLPPAAVKTIREMRQLDQECIRARASLKTHS